MAMGRRPTPGESNPDSTPHQSRYARRAMTVPRLVRMGAVLAAALAAAPGAAQAPDRTVRIGLLDYGRPSPSGEARWGALRTQLRELGYVAGRNVVFDARRADGHARPTS